MRIHSIVAALAATTLLACGGGKKQDTMGGGGGGSDTTDMAAKPLIDRLGGKAGITKVVDVFVGKVAADNRINAFFANPTGGNLDHLKAMLVDQICDAASGGTVCKYTGKSMEETHKGMQIKKAQFDALVEDLVAAMKEVGVGDAEQQEILGVLGPMEPQIVEP
jgi:hemoglobin